jgi:hypothetical protein
MPSVARQIFTERSVKSGYNLHDGVVRITSVTANVRCFNRSFTDFRSM